MAVLVQSGGRAQAEHRPRFGRRRGFSVKLGAGVDDLFDQIRVACGKARFIEAKIVFQAGSAMTAFG
jgi:hypothetical protein